MKKCRYYLASVLLTCSITSAAQVDLAHESSVPKVTSFYCIVIPLELYGSMSVADREARVPEDYRLIQMTSSYAWPDVYVMEYDGAGNLSSCTEISTSLAGPENPEAVLLNTPSYNEAGYLAEVTKQARCVQSPNGWSCGEWFNRRREIYSYSQGYVTRINFQTWKDEQWVDESRTTLLRDASGRITMGVEWGLGSSSQWVQEWRWLTTYDAQGNAAEEIGQSYSDSEGWTSTRRTLATFDAAGNETESIEQNWNPDNAQWQNERRRITTYDGAGREVETVTSHWGGVGWEYEEQEILFLYSPEGLLVETKHFDGSSTTTYDWQYIGKTTAIDADPLLPSGFSLSQNYPNPFNPSTTISYALPQAADARLTVVDLLGRQVRELASGTQRAGTYETTFDASGLPSGIYFYRLEAGDFIGTKGMVVVK